jgi:predicted nuclease of predicted toxin-antitoxin system
MMNLIFDVQSSGNYLNNKAEINKNHKVVCAGRDELRDLIDDEKIVDYAEKNHLIVVTKDVDFVKLCCKRNVKVAVLKGNYLFLIENTVQMFGQEPENRLFTND